jgi:hypothetical protein
MRIRFLYFICLLVISISACKTRKNLSTRQKPIRNFPQAVNASPTTSPLRQEIGFQLAVDPGKDVEIKFCLREEECPSSRGSAGTTLPFVLSAPSVYSARLCEKNTQNCGAWQLMLLHPVQELNLANTTPQEASSLVFAENKFKGFGFSSFGDGNMIASYYMFLEGFDVKKTATGLQLLDGDDIKGGIEGKGSGLPNLGNTCFLNATLQLLARSQEVRDAAADKTDLDDKAIDKIVNAMHAEEIKRLQLRIQEATKRKIFLEDLITIANTANDPQNRGNSFADYKQITDQGPDIKESKEKFLKELIQEINGKTENKIKEIIEGKINKYTLEIYTDGGTHDQIEKYKNELNILNDNEKGQELIRNRVIAEQDFAKSLNAVLENMNNPDAKVDLGKQDIRIDVERLMKTYDIYLDAIGSPGKVPRLWWNLRKQQTANEFLVNFLEKLDMGIDVFDGSSTTKMRVVRLTPEAKVGNISLQDALNKEINSGSKYIIANTGIPELTMNYDRTSEAGKITTPFDLQESLSIEVAFKVESTDDFLKQNMKLKSAIVHVGSGIHGGHYVTYVLESDGSFTLYSDDKVANKIESKEALPIINTNATALHFVADQNQPTWLDKSIKKSLPILQSTPPIRSHTSATINKRAADLGDIDKRVATWESQPETKQRISEQQRSHTNYNNDFDAVPTIIGFGALIIAPLIIEKMLTAHEGKQ